MKLRNIIWKVMLLLAVLPCLTACDKEKTVVVSSKFYIGTEVDPSDSYIVSLLVNKTDNVVTGSVQPKYSFVVRSTMPISSDVQVNVLPDETLVTDYNKANKTNFALLPTDNYTLTNKAIIKSGAYASTDSISVTLTKLSTLTSEGGYLLPLRMSSIEGGDNSAISSNRSIVYIKVDVALSYPGNLIFKGIEPLTGLTDIQRTDFDIQCATSPYNSSYSIAYLLDGNTTSAYLCATWTATPIRINMNSVHTVKGLSITAGYGAFSYSRYALKKFKVSVSRDGTKWVGYGETSLSQPTTSSSTNPFIQYVEFKTPLEIRYVRIEPLTAYNDYLNLSEINLFE